MMSDGGHKRLSKTQRAALSRLRDLHARAPRRDGRDPWVDMYDYDVNGRRVRLDTLRALERAGLVELNIKLRWHPEAGGLWNYWARPVGGA